MGRSVGWLAGWLAGIDLHRSQPPRVSAFLSTVSPPRFLLHLRPCFLQPPLLFPLLLFPSASHHHHHQCRAHATEEIEGEGEGEAVKPAGASQPASQPPASLYSTIYHRSFHHALFSTPAPFFFHAWPARTTDPETPLKGASLSVLLSVFAIPLSPVLFLVPPNQENIYSPRLSFSSPSSCITVLVSRFSFLLRRDLLFGCNRERGAVPLSLTRKPSF